MTRLRAVLALAVLLASPSGSALGQILPRAVPAAASSVAGAAGASPQSASFTPPSASLLPVISLAVPSAVPEGTGAPAAADVPVLSPAQAAAFMEQVARKERGFYQPGVAYDARTGMTHDSQPTDFRTGELRGEPRALSAASKESLHLILLIKALQGQREAQLALSPDPHDPSRAAEAALAVLETKIRSYEAFNREHPGFGGFLPWFQTGGGAAAPDEHWKNRVPALDNGELGWSMYLTAGALKELGHPELARRYQRHLELMKKNVVPIFFDPAAKKIRGVAVLKEGGRVAPERNAYETEGYFVNDPHEGLLMLHFADLFGDWTGRAADKEALWREPLRKLATYERSGVRITQERAWVGSSHEQWGFLIAPFLDVPLAASLFRNAQRVRAFDAADRGWPGMRASTHRPVDGDVPPEYVPMLGVAGVGTETPSPEEIFAPYAAFPLAVVDPALFATWLKRMLEAPGMWGPYGIGESFDASGKHAPLLTWDGKALPLIAWLGGITDDIRRLLIRDGLYEGFLSRVAADYRRLEGRPLEGLEVPLRTPHAG
jgi:hypothetical protein